MSDQEQDEAIHLNFGATRRELYGFVLMLGSGIWYLMTHCTVAC